MLLELIYQEDKIQIPINLKLEIGKYEHIGKGVYRTICKLNDYDCKRIHQPHISKNTHWSVNDRNVSKWFADELEIIYQNAIKDKIMIIHQNTD